jgi:galactokinase
MGGGFGGSIVALADEAGAVALAESARAEYCARSGQNGQGYVCRTADAAGAAATRAT